MSSAFIWYELLTSDADAAAAFYHQVIGWTQRPYGHGDLDYRILCLGEEGIAGVMAIPAEAASHGMKPAWHTYIRVADVDATVEAVAAAGGQVWMPATTTPGVGRMAMLRDPQGAYFYVMTPNGMDGESTSFDPLKPGHVGWNELHTSDAEAALRFYGAQLGWHKTGEFDMGPMGIYHLFNDTGAGEPVGGIFTDRSFPTPAWYFYINVDDVTTAASRLESAGGVVLHGPTQVPTGLWVIVGRDPQGAVFSVLGPKLS